MRRFFTICAALILGVAPALGQMQSNVVWDVPASQHYQGPGDITAFTAWYGLRAYSAAVAATGTQKAVDLRRNDGATCTALIGSNGDIDLTVGTPCNSNTQTVTAWRNAGPNHGVGCLGTISGLTLTITGGTGALCNTMVYGDLLVGAGVAAGTYIASCPGGSTCAVSVSQTITPAQAFSSSTLGMGVTKVYDQTSGNACAAASCDLTGAPDTYYVMFLPGDGQCFTPDTKPCMIVSGSGTPSMAAAHNFTPNAGAKLSTAAIANRLTAGGTKGLAILSSDGASQKNTITAKSGTANQWTLVGVSGSFSATANDNTWHSASGVILAGASAGVLNIDGTETTGTTNAGDTTAGAPTMTGSTSPFLGSGEFGFTDNVTWTSGVRTSLCHNMRLYWGTGGSC